MPKCTNGAIWSRTSSANLRHSAASQPATKRPMPVLPASSISSCFSLPAGDCTQALVEKLIEFVGGYRDAVKRSLHFDERDKSKYHFAGTRLRTHRAQH